MIKSLVYESKAIAKICIADTFIKRFLGYMFHKEPHHECILIKPCNSIHTFFMKFPLDVLFIDDNMKVVKKIENLKPGKIIMPQKQAVMVIEGKSGIFNNINEGSKLEVL